MRLVTRTETKTSVKLKALTRAYCSQATDCRCGQQLDLCAREHCPRCGRSISRA